MVYVNAPEPECRERASVKDWLEYLQSHKKILADGKKINLILY